MPTWRREMEPDDADHELDEADEAALKRDYPGTWASPDRPRTRRAADLYEEGVHQALLESGIDPETGRSLLESEGAAEDPEEAPDGRCRAGPPSRSV